jgi:hypothetical protein
MCARELIPGITWAQVRSWWEEEECSQVLVRYVTSLKGVPRAGYVIWKRSIIRLTGRCDRLVEHSNPRDPILSLSVHLHYFLIDFVHLRFKVVATVKQSLPYHF